MAESALVTQETFDFDVRYREIMVKLRELERTGTLVRDIMNCCVRKIVALAASPTSLQEIMHGLTLEEKSLYTVLNKTIEEWKARLLQAQESNPREPYFRS